MKQIHYLLMLLIVSMAHVVSAQAGNDGELELMDLNASNDGVTYVKVTDVSTLQDGDVVIIVNEEAGKAMGKSGTNNRKSVDVTISEDVISEIADDVELVTLEKTSKLWYLKSTSGYLYAKSTNANNMQTSNSTQGNYSKVSITITTGTTVVKFQGGSSYRSHLQYNADNKVFSCYRDNYQDPISLYKKNTSSTPVETVSLTIGSTGYASLYYSDKAFRVSNGLVAQTYKMNNDHLVISKTYTEGDVIPASVGVIFKGTPGSYQLVVADEVGVGDDANLLKGSDVDALTEGDGLFYKLSTYQGTNVGFYWAAEDGGPFVSKAHKAYLMTPRSVSAKGFMFDGTTGIDSVNTMPSASVEEEKAYTLAGQRMSRPDSSKGIYIVNGKKVVVR